MIHHEKIKRSVSTEKQLADIFTEPVAKNNLLKLGMSLE